MRQKVKKKISLSSLDSRTELRPAGSSLSSNIRYQPEVRNVTNKMCFPEALISSHIIIIIIIIIIIVVVVLAGIAQWI